MKVLSSRRVLAVAMGAALFSACDSATDPLPPSSFTIVAGGTQTVVARQAATDSLSVRVLNREGSPVRNATVTFTVTRGGGTVSPVTVRTNNDGVAKTRFTAGPTGGPATIVVSVAGMTATQTITLRTIEVFVTNMDQAQEVPTPIAVANVSGTTRYEYDGTKIDFVLSVVNLSGPALAAHLHFPSTPTTTAPNRVTYPISSAAQSGVISTGSFTEAPAVAATLTRPALAAVSLDSIIKLFRTGNVSYSNVHTTLNPPGEIRGNIKP